MEDFISVNFIPAWFVAVNMLAAGIMLRVSYKKGLRVNSTMFIAGTTMLLEAAIYAITFEFLDAQMRGLIGRLVIITLCMSLYLPLFVSYLRSKKRGN